MKLQSSYENITLLLVICMISGGLSSLYLKLFNMLPPAPVMVFHLPILLLPIPIILARFRSAIFGMFALLPFILLMALAAMSYRWSLDPMLTLREAAVSLLIGIYFACIAWSYSWRKIIDITWLAMFLMVLVSLFLFIAMPSLGKMSELFPGALMGLWLEKNSAGQIGAFGAILALARFATRPGKALSSGISFITFTAFLLLTTSKTALIAYMVGCGLFGWVFLMRRHVVITIFISWITVFASIFLVRIAASNQEAILKLAGRNATFTGRADIWKALQISTNDKPLLGHGYSAYWNEKYTESTLSWVAEELQFFPSHAHNSWLEMSLGLGVIGKSLLTLIVVMAVTFTITKLKSSNGSYFALPFLAMACVIGSFESILAYPNNFGGAILILVAAKALCKPMPADRERGLHFIWAQFLPLQARRHWASRPQYPPVGLKP